MLQKPPYGAPCNSCGLCCKEELCPLALGLFRKAPCPALVTDGERNTCGLIVRPAEFAPEIVARHGVETVSSAALVLVGSGVGCDAKVADEPDDDTFTQRMRRYSRENGPRIEAALCVFGYAPKMEG